MVFFPETADRGASVYGWRDALTYHEDAEALASLWQGTPQPMSEKLSLPEYMGYPVTLAILYYFLGPSYLLGVLMNIIFGVTTCVLTYWLGREVFDEALGRQGALLLAIFPLHIYFCCFTLKDPVLLMLIVASSLFAFKVIYGKKSLLWLLFFFIVLFAMIFLRRQVTMVLFTLLFTGLIIGNPRRFLKMLPILVILPVVGFLGYGQFRDDPMSMFFSESIIELQEKKLMELQTVTRETRGEFSIILVIFGYIVPFPTLVMMGQAVGPDYQIESSVFLWNILAGLSLVGIWFCLKQDWRKKYLIWTTPLVFFLGEAFFAIDTLLDIRRSKFMILPFACLLGVYALQNWKSPLRYAFMGLYVAGVVMASLVFTYLRLAARGQM
jgi:4-amino-4-deoxy-L-arabinose transferase-like glycosyltransferase